MRVGFIGLGTMGATTARNILRKGFPLVVHDRVRKGYNLCAGDMTVCKLLEDDSGVDLRISDDWVASWGVPTPTLSLDPECLQPDDRWRRASEFPRT